MTNLNKKQDGIIILQVHVQISLCIQVLPELPSRRGMFFIFSVLFYKRYFKKKILQIVQVYTFCMNIVTFRKYHDKCSAD